MTPPVRATVVTAVRGNSGALPGLLRCLADQDIPAEELDVVVVDNHPQPVIPESLAAGTALPVTVAHEPRPGLSRARNAGIRLSSGTTVLITDPDARPHPQWASALLDALASTGASCAGGPVRCRGTDTPLPEGLDPDVHALFAPLTWPGEVTTLGPRQPYWLVGCNLALRRDPLLLFCERLGRQGRRQLACEDLELVARAEHAGLPVVLTPTAVVDRAIHPSDLRWTRILRRGFGHGISITRVGSMHPQLAVLDSYRQSLVWQRLSQRRWLAAGLAQARILGHHLERLRARARRLRPRAAQDPTP